MNKNLSFELDGIRVWRGFIAEHFFHQRDAFASNLKSIFIPQTAQQMMRLGLQSYFPAIVPKSNTLREIAIPDEVALLVYPSDADYQTAAKNNVAGRAYGALHGTAFNFNPQSAIPQSRSGYHIPWVNDWGWGQTYSLLFNSPDWHAGQTSVLLAEPSRQLSTAAFYQAVSEAIENWLHEQKIGIGASIICVDQDYLLYWEHSNSEPGNTEQPVTSSLIPRLKPLLEAPHVYQRARTVIVPPAFTIPDGGVDCEMGELLSVEVAEKE